MDQAEIVFFDLAVPDFFIDDPQRFRILRGNDDAAGVAVNPVAESGSKRILLFRPPFTLLREVGLDVGDQRVIIPLAGAVTENARLLVGEKDVFIFIDDRNPGLSDLQIRVFFLRLFKELIIDVKLDTVSV